MENFLSLLSLSRRPPRIYLPRMEEEVDAVLDTRAVGATTAEREAIACIVKGGKAQGLVVEDCCR